MAAKLRRGPSKPQVIRRFRACPKRWRVEPGRAVPCSETISITFRSPGALPRVYRGALEKTCAANVLKKTFQRLSTKHAADAGVSEPKECREDLFRRDRLPQPELGGAASGNELHKFPA